MTTAPDEARPVKKRVDKVTQLKEEKKALKKEVNQLGKRARESERRAEELEAELVQAEDFANLKELYPKLDEIERWEREVTLPFAKAKFRFKYGTLHLRIYLTVAADAAPEYQLYGTLVSQLQEFGSALEEALEKGRQLDELRRRLGPLTAMVRAAADVLNPEALEDDE